MVVHTVDPLNDERSHQFLGPLASFQLGFITNDDWNSYLLEIHLTGKIFTQRIKNNNLTIRIRLKRQLVADL